MALVDVHVGRRSHDGGARFRDLRADSPDIEVHVHTAEPFVIPAEIAAAWAAFGEKGKALHAEWDVRLASNEKKKEFEDRLSGKIVPGDAFKAYLEGLAAEPPKVATRKASENTLGALTADIAALVGGSADLTGSNNTKTSSTKPLTKNERLALPNTTTKKTPKKSKLTKNLINVPAKNPKNEPVAALKARFPSFEL